MFTNRKSTTLIALALVLTLLPISVGESRERSTTEQQTMSPYDIAVLPLDQVPEPNIDVYRHSFSDYDNQYASSEVLRVLKDPRKIPIERFLYYKHPRGQLPSRTFRDPHDRSIYQERIQLSVQVVSYPYADQILGRFKDEAHSAIAVYVRTVGDVDEYESYADEYSPTELMTRNQLDPFYIRDPILDYWMVEIWDEELDDLVSSYPDWTPWSYLAVSDSESDLTFPCMPQQVLNLMEPYENPDTGEMIDPASYLPPKPWYLSPSWEINQGEVREGWLLCLAPDVPVEQIELVKLTGENIYDGSFSNKVEDVVWMHPDSRQMGEWHLLPDMELVAWNGPIVDTLAEFETLDLHDVYRGDVWISIASAFTNNALPELEDAAYSGLSLQLYFEGMDDLLQAWEHVALREWLSLELCFNRQLSECVKVNQHSEPDGTMIEVPYHCPEGSIDCPDTNLVETRAYFNSILAYSPGDWVEVSILEKHPEDYIDVFLVGLESRTGVVQINREVPGRILTWHLEPQLIKIPVLTTHDICEEVDIDCIPEDALFLISTGELDYSPPVLDGPIPIIPFGQSAHGIRILNSYTSDDPVLMTHGLYDLDMRLVESDSILSDFQWLIIDIEVIGFSDYLLLYSDGKNGTFKLEGGGDNIIFSNNGPHLAFRSPWVTTFRSGLSNHGSLESIPDAIQLDDLILVIDSVVMGGGPAFKITGKGE